MVDTPASNLQKLNLRRRHAVEMRLAGQTLSQIREATGLSAPTVIGAYRAFLSKGWAGVAVAGRGRQVGRGRTLTPSEEAELCSTLLTTRPESASLPASLWTLGAVRELSVLRFGRAPGERALVRLLQRAGLALASLHQRASSQPAAAWDAREFQRRVRDAQRAGSAIAWCGELAVRADGAVRRLLVAQTPRGSLAWLPIERPFRIGTHVDFLSRLAATWPQARHLLLHGIDPRHPILSEWLGRHPELTVVACPLSHARRDAPAADAGPPSAPPGVPRPAFPTAHPMKLTHLQRLEAESIHIIREVVAEAERPVMLYSIGKDSATMLHIARKAFHPAPPPFPLLHVDTTWKFRDMYALRERMAREAGMELLVWQNPEAKAMGINPFDHGSQIHTDLWKTQGLKQALDHYGFDAAFGGARRDEEKSRAKERIFSFRSDQHRWDPKNQRPELWNLYNARKRPGESIRVFPLSNWTELDIWQYIWLEQIPIVPLYLAKERPVVERDGVLLMVDDERFRLDPDEVPVMRKVRFRTLGCYPLSGAIESDADTLPAVIQEMLLARTSERQGRMIDHDQAASMEKKKQEGYF
jgi:sulfate adenylyltransferase subunit 2